MKSQKGVTLASLIIYVIAMTFVVATIATVTNYFYGNINGLSTRTNAAKEFTSFSSYFINEINDRENGVIEVSNDGCEILFSSGTQVKYVNNSIYYNKIKICKDVVNCQFSFHEDTNTVNVIMNIAGKTYNNEYTLQ